MADRKPCPGAEYGCDRMIPVAWPWCRVRGCKDRATQAERLGSDDPFARELGLLVQARDRDAELRELLAQQEAELRRPFASKYRHYERAGAGSSGKSLDEPLHSRSTYRDTWTLAHVLARHPNRTQVEWFDPTWDTVEARMDAEAALLAYELERVNRRAARRVELLPWSGPVDFQAGFNSWEHQKAG